MQSQNPDRAPFYAALVLYTFALLPVIRADRYYIDDLGRAISGYMSWTGDGRPLANLVMEVLNLGTPLTDLSPLPQLLCAGLLAALASSIARRFAIRGAVLPALICAPLLISPFYLENLSYKFDALTMTLAVFLAVRTVLDARADIKAGVLGGFGLLASLCLYQPAMNAFLVFALVELVVMQQRNQQVGTIARHIGMRVAQLVGALIAYKLVATLTVKGAYSSEHGQIASIGDLGEVAGRNLFAFWEYVIHALTSPMGAILLACIAIAVAIAILSSARYAMRHWATSSRWQRMWLIALALCMAPLLAVAPWGPMLALTAPPLVPRTMVGFGALAAAANLVICVALPKSLTFGKWRIAIAALPAFALLIFAQVYGNTLKLQKEYEDFMSRQISDDLVANAPTGGFQKYTLVGNAGRPPVSLHNLKKYPLLAALVPVHLTENWGWANMQLKHLGVTLPPVLASASAKDIAEACERLPIIRRVGYSLYTAGTTAVVVFRSTHCEMRPATEPIDR